MKEYKKGVTNSDVQLNTTTIPHWYHTLPHEEISKNALKVLCRLTRAGHEAYLVGGGVRDLLLGKKPKDFDITTSATPEQIRKLFRNCRLVGQRFRLAHVIFNKEIIEVATFRGHHDENIIANQVIHPQCFKQDIPLQDNIFGSIEEDAQRRDFTINSLYYSVIDFMVRDYVGGIQDIKEGLIRLVGNPEIRYREDPVRMLRAVRFSVKLNMRISPETSEPILRLAKLINNIPPPRLFEEVLKLFQTGFGYEAYKLLRQYRLFHLLFPVITCRYIKDNNSLTERIITQALKNIDNHIHNNIQINPAFLFSAMFWYPLLQKKKRIMQENCLSYYDAFALAINNILSEICFSLAIPRRITTLIRDIWQLQMHMLNLHSKRAWKILDNPTFFLGYSLLVLREKVEENSELRHLVRWWNKFFTSSIKREKKCMINTLRISIEIIIIIHISISQSGL